MRYKPDHKEETHRRIVRTAAGEFRTHGFEGIGIGKLMGKLKLTHGGFYAHFADKEALVAEAMAEALEQSLNIMLRELESGGVPAMLAYYLSEEHRDRPANGCPLPCLAAEVARRPASSRESFTENLAEFFERIADHVPGATSAQRLERARVLFASMAGAMSLARAVSDPDLSRSLLRSTHDHLLRFLEQEE